MWQLAIDLLPGYQTDFASKAIADDDFAQATLVHPEVNTINQVVLFPTEQEFGLGIVTAISHGRQPLTICNFHGRSRPGNKLDTPERLAQFRAVIDYFRTLAVPLIIGGDFNVDIDTESIRMFELAGYTNLIKKFKIRTTRNRIAWKRYPLTPQLHSDYVFVNDQVRVKSFEVPEVEISDHLPMILNIE